MCVKQEKKTEAQEGIKDDIIIGNLIAHKFHAQINNIG